MTSQVHDCQKAGNIRYLELNPEGWYGLDLAQLLELEVFDLCSQAVMTIISAFFFLILSTEGVWKYLY